MQQAPSTTRFTAALGLLAAVLWVVQLAGGWEPPHQRGEMAQQYETGLTQVIEREWGNIGRVQAPEGQPDTSALTGAEAVSSTHFAPYIFTITAGTPFPHNRDCTRPAVRAPPQATFSA